jgi:acetolactate synthase-1/2/3 large subunit
MSALMSETARLSHPAKGQALSGAEILVQVLADEGVEAIFGYSGGAILPVYDALYRFNDEQQKISQEGIDLVVPANEQGAGFMASGYAASTGKVGVVLVTSGPGATNVVTPIRDCLADSIPIVVICGQVPVASMGTDAFQEAPILNALSPCAKHVFLVKDPEKLESTVRTAFEIARTGRPGPVVIDLPKDVQNWKGTFKGEGKLPVRGYRQRLEQQKTRVMPDEHCQSFFALLKESERPLIVAGGGVIISDASAELKIFAERYGIPVANTLNGLGSFDTTHDLSLRMIGMHGTAYANYAVEDCDLLISIGFRFDDRVAGKPTEFAPNAKAIAHIDIDESEIGKIKSTQWSFVGDAKESLQRLLAYGKDFRKDFSSWVEYVVAMKQKYPMNYHRQSDLIQPEYVLEELNRLVQGKAIIATGVGQHQMWAAQFMDFTHPRHWLTSGAMATMGFGLPAAIGAQVGNPDLMVIDIDGDGSIRMNLGEMETVTNYALPVKVLLLNNAGDGMVRQWQRLFFGSRLSGSDKSQHKKDFVKAAEADGYPFAKRVSDKSELIAALQEFVAFKGPAFLEVMIDHHAHVYPMVGPGMSYKQMDTGKYIASRPARAEVREEYDPLKMPDLF